MNIMKGFKELQIEDTRDVNDGVQHATLMNTVGASIGLAASGGTNNQSTNNRPITVPGTGGGSTSNLGRPQVTGAGSGNNVRFVVLGRGTDSGGVQMVGGRFTESQLAERFANGWGIVTGIFSRR